MSVWCMSIAIILGSNQLDKVEFASMTAFLASSMGDDVTVFATMDGVQAFRKEPSVLSSADSARKIVEVENGGKFLDYFKKAKGTGKVKITACSMASRLFGLGKEDFMEIVDGIGGLTSFLDSSEGSRLMSIW